MSRRSRERHELRVQREALSNPRLPVRYSEVPTSRFDRPTLPRRSVVLLRPRRVHVPDFGLLPRSFVPAPSVVYKRVGKNSAELNTSFVRSRLVQPTRSAVVAPSRPLTVGRFSSPVVTVQKSRVLSECEKRSRRSEVLHALRKVGRGSATGRRKPKSEVVC